MTLQTHVRNLYTEMWLCEKSWL